MDNILCDYQGCDSIAKYYDASDSTVCHDCMEREVENGTDPEEFEDLQEALNSMDSD